MSDLFDSKGDFLVKSGNTAEALENYQESLDIGNEEYEFTSETKKKIKKYKSELN